VWNADNVERVLKDERLHREALEQKEAEERERTQEKNLELLRGASASSISNVDGGALVLAPDAVLDGSSSKHLNLFQEEEENAERDRRRVEAVQRKAADEALNKKRQGVADWALGEGSLEARKQMAWYERKDPYAPKPNEEGHGRRGGSRDARARNHVLGLIQHPVGMGTRSGTGLRDAGTQRGGDVGDARPDDTISSKEDSHRRSLDPMAEFLPYTKYMSVDTNAQGVYDEPKVLESIPTAPYAYTNDIDSTKDAEDTDLHKEKRGRKKHKKHSRRKASKRRSKSSSSSSSSSSSTSIVSENSMIRKGDGTSSRASKKKRRRDSRKRRRHDDDLHDDDTSIGRTTRTDYSSTTIREDVHSMVLIDQLRRRREEREAEERRRATVLLATADMYGIDTARHLVGARQSYISGSGSAGGSTGGNGSSSVHVNKYSGGNRGYGYSSGR
jgi:hypothetical protein